MFPFLLRRRNRNMTQMNSDSEEMTPRSQVELQFSQSSQLEALSAAQTQSGINVQALLLEAYQKIGTPI